MASDFSRRGSERDMTPYLEGLVRSLVADPALSKPTGSNSKDAKYAARASLRGGVGVRMISVATGVLLVLASAGHAQSPMGILSPGEPVERPAIPGPTRDKGQPRTRMLDNRAIGMANHSASTTR
jgi:hypothetical protein